MSWQSSVLLILRTKSFDRRGASVNWLSAFPGEEEILFPPLTLLQKAEAEDIQSIHIEGKTWQAVVVEPRLP